MEDGKRTGAYINWEALDEFLGRHPVKEGKPPVDLMSRIRGNKELPKLIESLQVTLGEVNEYGSDDLDLRDLLVDVIALLKG